MKRRIDITHITFIVTNKSKAVTGVKAMNLPEMISESTIFPRSQVMMVVNCPLCIALIGQIHVRRSLDNKPATHMLEQRLVKRVMALIDKHYSIADALMTAILAHPGSQQLSGYAGRPDFVIFKVPTKR